MRTISHLGPLCVLAAGLVFLISAAPVAAVTWTVLPDGTGDAPTIQAAIDLASPGDIVELVEGVFTGEGNRDIDFLGKAITLRSQSGNAADCVIDCEASADDHHRGFVFQSGESSNTRLENITITNGYVEGEDPLPDGTGGGILVTDGSSPTLVGVVFRDNTAMAGGGMFVTLGSHPTLEGCTFVDNNAWWGSGGALSISLGEELIELTECVFRGNSANQAGGAVASADCELRLTGCEFYDNAIVAAGGAVDVFSHADCELVGCTFAGNTASSGGAVYVWFFSSCTLRNCTLVDNEATSFGSGIGVDSDSIVNVNNTIVAFGRQTEAVGCWDNGEVLLDCCDVYGNEGGDWVGCIADQLISPGNTSEDPLFCGEDNPEQPFTLHADSPCAPGSYPCLQVGAWPLGCDAVSAVLPQLTSARGCVLRKVVPNPFNPRTTVSFSVLRDQLLTIAVFDLAGKRVVELARGLHVAGEYEIDWRGEDARGRAPSAGPYFLRLEAADGVQSQKVMLVR